MIKILSFIIIALSIVFIFLSQDKTKSTGELKAPVVRPIADESEKINKYLQEVEFNKRARAIKMGHDIDHERIGRGANGNNSGDNNGDGDDILKRDLESGSGLDRDDHTPSFQDQIEAEKIRMQQEFENHVDPTDAYVQQFIENARRDGLVIKVDKNNQIIDIQKIPE